VKRAVVLKHVPFEGPALIGQLLSERGYELDVRELHQGAAVPERLTAGELLLVMGGPMGVADLDRPELPFLRQEADLLGRCIAEDAAVLGVCLGAQLLAFAAGAAVQPLTDASGQRCYEVGWGPVRLHSLGKEDPILRGLPAEAPVLHWHGDAFELPRGGRLLASTAACAQGFQLGQRQFGLQFHCEVGPEQVEQFLRVDAAFVERANGADGIEQIRRGTERHVADALAAGTQLLQNLLSTMDQEEPS
jgi:GMP synthase-like glutamine amidotransferase